MKNFDQWIEALSKDIYGQAEEDNAKVLWRMDEFFDEEMEEEE